MAKKIQHLRGTLEEYQRINLTPLSGELALEEGEDGYTRMKIGDGKTPYLALPYLQGTVKFPSPDKDGVLSLVLHHGYEYRSGVLTSLELMLPEHIREDYTSSVVFDTFLTESTVSYPKEMVFTGDDCEGGLFLPKKRMRYTVTLNNRTGAIYAEVRGASHDLAYQSYYEVVCEHLPATAPLRVSRADRLLDVALEGALGHADTDGYVTGLGNYDWENERFRIPLLWQNGCILDFKEVKEKVGGSGSYFLNTIGYASTEGEFSYLAGTDGTILLASASTHPLASDFQYRLRARVTLSESTSTFSVGDTLPAPFKLYYGTEAYVPTMTYTCEGDFTLDFTTEQGRALTRISLVGIGKEGRVHIQGEGFSLVARKGEYECESVKRRVEMTASLSAPLRSAHTVRDTLSLCSERVVRRVEACTLSDFSYENYDENYVVFRVDLPVKMDSEGVGEMPYFERASSYEELSLYPMRYYFDPHPGNGVLYFSADASVQSVSDMQAWIYERYDILGYAYPRETPSVEEISFTTPLVPYEGYTFLMIPNVTNASFVALYYDNEEKGEEC